MNSNDLTIRFPPEGTRVEVSGLGESQYVIGTYHRCQRLQRGCCTMRSLLCLDCLERGDVPLLLTTSWPDDPNE